MEWKFEIGDITTDKYNLYKIIERDQKDNGYWIKFEGERYFISKGLMETCELVNPKSLFEEALALIDLEIGQEFMFTPRKDGLYPNRYKFEDDSLWIYEEGINRWDCSGISLEIILRLPQNVKKVAPLVKPKSEPS